MPSSEKFCVERRLLDMSDVAAICTLSHAERENSDRFRSADWLNVAY